MKKVFWVVLVLLVASIAAVYLFIPSPLRIAKITVVNSNPRTIYRCLTDTILLRKMMATAKLPSSVSRNYVTVDGVEFEFKEPIPGNLMVSINYDGDELNSLLSLLNLTADSAVVEWRTQMESSNNPLRRIGSYRAGEEIKSKMTETLECLQRFVAKKENVYGAPVTHAKVTDTMLVTMKTRTTSYPTKEEYYCMIKKLQDYVTAQKGNAVNYPMLNITFLDSTRFETMVALPVNKELPSSGAILFKRMVAGNILTTEITGGPTVIESGFQNLDSYAADHQLYSAALPFQLLVSNRLTEPDSSKWVTKLFAPIY